MIPTMSKQPRIPTELERAIIDVARKSGLTQTELAARSGVEQGTLSRFLSDDPGRRRTITLPLADKLCKALGLKLVKGRKSKRRKG